MGLVTSKKTVGGVSLRRLWAGCVVVMEVGSVKRCDLRRLLVLWMLAVEKRGWRRKTKRKGRWKREAAIDWLLLTLFFLLFSLR